MATLGNTPRPAYVYDTETDTWVPIGVGAHTHDTLYVNQNIIDAKGDLIVGTSDNSYDRLAAGNSGDTLLADSSATTGLRWQEPKAGNPVINSAFQVWQRGTSIATTSYPYTADRWISGRAGGVGGGTVSRQTTGDTTNLPNIQYCARVQRDSGNTSTAISNFGQPFETVNSIPFAGKTVTLSFYARKGANFSGTSDQIQVYLVTGTGTDQNGITSTYTGSVNAINGQNATLTTTWQRFSFTATLNSNITEMNITFNAGYTGTAGAADYYEITGVQLEVGSVATPFKTQGVTLAGELAACQRYYWRNTSISATSGFMWLGVIANYYSTTRIDGYINYPVRMRSIPSSVDFASIGWIRFWGEGVTSISAVTINTTATSDFGGILQFTTTGTATTNPHLAYYILSNNAAGYIGLSAEL